MLRILGLIGKFFNHKKILLKLFLTIVVIGCVNDTASFANKNNANQLLSIAEIIEGLKNLDEFRINLIEKGFTQKTMDSYTNDTWFYGNKLNPDLSVRIEKLNYTNIDLNTNIIEVRISKSERGKIDFFNKELESYFPIKKLLKGSTSFNGMKEDYYILRYTNKDKTAYNVDVYSYDSNYAIFKFSFSFH